MAQPDPSMTALRKKDLYPLESGSQLSRLPFPGMPSKSLSQPGPPELAIRDSIMPGQSGPFPAGMDRPGNAAKRSVQATTASPFIGQTSWGMGYAPDAPPAQAAPSSAAGPSPGQGPIPFESKGGWKSGYGDTGNVSMVQTTMPSPHESKYYEDFAGQRGIEATQEQQRVGLLGETEQMLQPQAWAHAGRDDAYWAHETQRRVAAANANYVSEKSQIEQMFRMGQINSAERKLRMERLERDTAAARSAAYTQVEDAKRDEGFKAAMAKAGVYQNLFAAVPRERKDMALPRPLPLEAVDTRFKGGGGGGSTWTNVPKKDEDKLVLKDEDRQGLKVDIGGIGKEDTRDTSTSGPWAPSPTAFPQYTPESPWGDRYGSTEEAIAGSAQEGAFNPETGIVEEAVAGSEQEGAFEPYIEPTMPQGFLPGGMRWPWGAGKPRVDPSLEYRPYGMPSR